MRSAQSCRLVRGFRSPLHLRCMAWVLITLVSLCTTVATSAIEEPVLQGSGMCVWEGIRFNSQGHSTKPQPRTAGPSEGSQPGLGGWAQRQTKVWPKHFLSVVCSASSPCQAEVTTSSWISPPGPSICLCLQSSYSSGKQPIPAASLWTLTAGAGSRRKALNACPNVGQDEFLYCPAHRWDSLWPCAF